MEYGNSVFVLLLTSPHHNGGEVLFFSIHDKSKEKIEAISARKVPLIGENLIVIVQNCPGLVTSREGVTKVR